MDEHIQKEVTEFLGKDITTELDWNLIMEALAKIEKMSYSRGRHYFLKCEQSYVEIRVDRMNIDLFGKWGTSSNFDKFKAVCRAVTEFIIWNKKRKK